MKVTACLALIAGSAIASTAIAQTTVAPFEPQSVSLQGMRVLAAPGIVLPENYQQRLINTVYSSNNAGALTFFLGIAGIYDDMRYNALFGATPDINVDDLSMLLAVPSGNVETGAKVRVTIYNTHSAPGVFPPGSVVLAQEDFDFPVGSFVNAGAGAVAFNVIVGGWDPIINTGDQTISAFVQVRTLDDSTFHPTVRPVIVRNLGPSVGTSLGGVYLDVNNDAVIGTGEGPFIAAAGDTAATMTFNVLGDLAVPPPAGVTNLGTLAACTPVLQNAVVPINGVTWYQFTVPNGTGFNGVFAVDNEALTIDTEGTITPIDSVLALYDDRGNLIIVEDDDGTDFNSQMSFGIGRWNGPGNGLQYDGRDLGLAAGSYIVGVTSFAPGLTFDDNFIVTGTNPTADAVTLNINLYNNTCLPAVSLPPVSQDLGQINSPGLLSDSLSSTGAGGGLRWFKFSTCAEIADPAKFFDVDFSVSTADLVAVLFNSSGNQIAFSDDADANPAIAPDYFLPQLSFGNVGPRVGGGLDALPLAGQNGTLPAGEYYLAVGAFPLFTLPAAAGLASDRFHAAAFNPAVPVLMQFFASTDQAIEDCGSACPVCPADYNQDGGVTGDDIAAFFADFEAGGGCSDTNLDGGITGDDIAAFFTAFESGGC